GSVMLTLPAEFAPPPPTEGAVVLLCDPYTFPVDGFLTLLQREWRGALAVGGLASGGGAPGDHVLLCGREAKREGAVVLELGGAAYVGDQPRIGQTMRFHIRDAASADGDLRQALRGERALPVRLVAGVLFACNGRGRRMFPQADHDAAAVEQELGDLPTAGMF